MEPGKPKAHPLNVVFVLPLFIGLIFWAMAILSGILHWVMGG